MLRNYLICLSFANLVYLRAWSGIISGPGDVFFRKTLPGINLYFAIAGDVLVLSLLTFLLICCASKLPGWFQRALPIAAIAVVLFAVRSVAANANVFRFGLFRFFSPEVLFLITALFAIVGVVLAFRFSYHTLRLARFAALAAVPWLLVTFVEAPLHLHAQPPLPRDAPLAPRLSVSPPVRVIWILFDEWDQRLTFPNRAPGTLLPVLDNLTKTSFAATGALGPEAGMPVNEMATVRALPTLLYGRRLIYSANEGPATRRLDFADGSFTVLGQGDNIFARVRSHGWNSAVAGWYLPYCRLAGFELSECYWDELFAQPFSARPAALEAAMDETRMLFETPKYSPFGASLVAVRHANEYEALLAAARRYAADPTIGLTFIHFNVPHMPYFYNPKAGHFRSFDHSSAHYDDALQLVDRTVGEIRSSLSAAGLDSKTALILSSDHPARFPTRVDGGQDPHVPFIVHLPGNSDGLAWDEEFSTIGTGDLVLAIAAGEVKSPSDVADFLTESSWHKDSATK